MLSFDLPDDFWVGCGVTSDGAAKIRGTLSKLRSIEPILTVIPREFTLGETMKVGIQRGKQRLPRRVIDRRDQ